MLFIRCQPHVNIARIQWSNWNSFITSVPWPSKTSHLQAWVCREELCIEHLKNARLQSFVYQQDNFGLSTISCGLLTVLHLHSYLHSVISHHNHVCIYKLNLSVSTVKQQVSATSVIYQYLLVQCVWIFFINCIIIHISYIY